MDDWFPKNLFENHKLFRTEALVKEYECAVDRYDLCMTLEPGDWRSGFNVMRSGAAGPASRP
jgi:hypothetical protein